MCIRDRLSSAVRTLLATGGVIAVVAGLAAQEALGSVVSGVMILASVSYTHLDVYKRQEPQPW